MKYLFLFLLICLAQFGYSQRMVETYEYKGTIGGFPIVLKFRIPDKWYNFDEGEYYYTKVRKAIQFAGSEPQDGEVKIQKLNEKVDGKITGYFIFDSPDYFLVDIIGNQRITGRWYNAKGDKSFDVFLSYVRKF